MFSNFANNKGISIFIAIFFTGVVTLIALGVNKVIVPFLKGSTNVEIMNQAYFAAEAGIEDALYDLSEHESGYEHEIVDLLAISQDETIQFKWRIKSIIPELTAGSNHYRIPPKNAGTSDDREWNIIKKNQSEIINLFVDNSNYGSPPVDLVDIKNASDLNITRFIMTLRAPSDIVLLDSETEEISISDDTIMTWTFFGNDKNPESDKRYSLQEITAYDPPATPDAHPARKNDESTEIYESKINCVPDDGGSNTENLIIDTSIVGISQCSSINQGTNQDEIPQNILDFLQDINIQKPAFKFSVVSDLVKDDIPPSPLSYLEYQIHVFANESIPNVKSIISATGYAGNFQQKLDTVVRKQATESFIDFAVFQ